MLNPLLLCVVAARHDQVRSGTAVPPGVKPGNCAGCNCRLWLSPSSRKLIAAGTHQPVCTACLPRGKRFKPVLTPEAKRELEGWNKPPEIN